MSDKNPNGILVSVEFDQRREAAFCKLTNELEALQAENAQLKELLVTERMSNEKTYDHNNRLINEVDRLREALEKIIAYDMADRIDAAKDIARAALGSG